MAYLGGGSAYSTYVSTTLVGASVAAGGAELTHATEPWAKPNQGGIVLPSPNQAAANAVYPVSWRCTTAGTVLVLWANPTAGALTPANASGANPYTFIALS